MIIGIIAFAVGSAFGYFASYELSRFMYGKHFDDQLKKVEDALNGKS